MSRLNHVGISVKNLEASRKFYEDVFGLEFQKEGEGEMRELGIRFIVLADKEGNAIELFEAGKQTPLTEDLMDFSRHGIKHIAFTVDSIEKTLERAVSRRAEVMWPAQKAKGKIKRFAFIKDLDGIPIELAEV